MANARAPVSFLATTEPQKAQAFYANVLGLDLLETSQYALAFRDGKGLLRVQVVDEFVPAKHTVHGWQTTDIEHEIKELTAKGARFQKFPTLSQDALGIWTTLAGDKVAWFQDPDGNILSLTEISKK